MKLKTFKSAALVSFLGCVLSGARAQPPVILVQPTNAVTLPGGTAALSVVVSGPGLFNFQWQFNGTNVSDIIQRVAGEYLGGFSGDGGPATSALMSVPVSVAVDAAGELFIADFNNQRVRKVDTNGIITTVAGTGAPGFSGDGGAAANAEINGPSGVAVDAWGNLFIADFNNRVRKMDTNGVITTVAGNGAQGYSGDGGASTNAEISFGALNGAVETLGITMDGAQVSFFAVWTSVGPGWNGEPMRGRLSRQDRLPVRGVSRLPLLTMNSTQIVASARTLSRRSPTPWGRSPDLPVGGVS